LILSEIDDGLPQVSLEVILPAQIREPSGDPDERVMNEILSELVVAGENVGESECAGGVPPIELT
jgi:hypothetical protein